jgi:hypothetical protein
MTDQLLKWDVYEIISQKSSLNGVMLRGRIRKLGLKNNFNVLCENTQDIENGVRFAVLDDAAADAVNAYIKSIVPDAVINLVSKSVPNPVISKMQVNIESRYTL